MSETQFMLITSRIQTVGETKGVATGFHYSFKYKNEDLMFFVTNKHVIQSKTTVIISFLKKQAENGVYGEKIDFPVNPNAFRVHPDYDLAFIPMSPIVDYLHKQETPITFKWFSQNQIPTDSSAFNQQLSDVYFIGYPDGLWDSKNYLPIIRKGSLASFYGIDYGGQRRFLIDATVIPGSSGSPVFVYDPVMHRVRGKNVIGVSRILFLGILDITFRQRPIIGTQEVPIPLSREEDSDPIDLIRLGGVIKSEVIQSFIESNLKFNGGVSLKPKQVSHAPPNDTQSIA